MQQSYVFYSEKWIYAHIHTDKENFASLLSLHSLTVTQFSLSLKISLFCAQSYLQQIIFKTSTSGLQVLKEIDYQPITDRVTKIPHLK